MSEEQPWPNSFARDLDYPQGSKDHAKIIDGGSIAVLPDGTLLRCTPPGQPTVQDLVHPGDVVSTNYGAGGRVYQVNKRVVYGIPTFSVVYMQETATIGSHGTVKVESLSWVNELVAQCGTIVHLFKSNDDMVTVSWSVLVE